MKTLAKALGLVAGLAPAVADAHCCCEHRDVSDRMAEQWDRARYEVTAGRPCGNYPASAARARASGVTWVKLRVDRDGFVEAAQIRDSSGRADLDRAAIACATHWHLGTGYRWRVARITWRWVSYSS